MKTYIYYIVFLLAAFVQPLLAQDAPVTKAQPPFPALPYAVTYTASSTGGTVALSVPGNPDPTSVASGEKIYSGTVVTLKVTPTAGDTNYKVVFGSLKVYYTNATSTVLPLNTVSGSSGEYTFVMPANPVTVGVEFEQKPAPSSDARLKALQYKVGDDTPGTFISVPSFSADTEVYNVTLPSTTADDAQITLSGAVADTYASLPNVPVTTTLSNGSGSATLTVTAENGTTAGYKVNFEKAAADKFVVTINPPAAGGTITVTDANNKVLESGAVVDNNAVLTLTNTPVAGYAFSTYVVGNQPQSDPTVTVTADVTISAEFNAPSTPIQPENIGTPAVPKEEEEATIPTDAPVVIIPDAGSLPEDTELSQLRLVKGDVDNTKKADVIADAKAAMGNTNIPDANMIPMEVTLVKVTTTFDGSTGKSETTVTPVQPTDKVKVRIPYPENVDKSKKDFTIIHLKSDGTTDVYSEANRNLMLEDEYMEITVTGFSPFVVAYVDKPKPNPKPDPQPQPDPVYYTVTLPAVAGATTDPVPGSYEVEAWDSFRFYLTLDKDYDQSDPVVTTSRGETITPRTSDGAYLVKYVRSAVTISIAGIKKNTDVANETIEAGVKVWTEPSALCLETDRTEEVRIVTVSGSTVAVFEAKPGLNRRALAPGLYIIQTPRTVCKVIVR